MEALRIGIEFRDVSGFALESRYVRTMRGDLLDIQTTMSGLSGFIGFRGSELVTLSFKHSELDEGPDVPRL